MRTTPQLEEARRAQPIVGRALARHTRGGIALRLFLTCWLLYALHFATNVVRELYPVLSLGDHLSFDVSEYVGLHPDIFEFEGRGAFINNNPGASIMGALPYLLARPLIDPVVARVRAARGPDATPPTYETEHTNSRAFFREAYRRGLDVKLGLAAAVTQALLMAPLSALSVVLIFYLLLWRGVARRPALGLALLYAFATPIFYRTAQLNQNLLISHAALFAFVLLWRPWAGGERPARPHFFPAGLLAGWCVVLDYSGLVALLALGGYALLRWWALPAERRGWGGPLAFGGGVALAGAVLLAYQWSAFGHPLYPAQRYMPPTPFSVYGYNGMTLPQLDLLLLTAAGPRFGLFTSAPLLLLALGASAWWGGNQLVGRHELAYILFFSVALFLFTAANQFGRLQFNTGVRYIVPIVPPLFLLAASVLLRLPSRLAVAVGLVSTYWSWVLAMYRDVEYGLGIFEGFVHIPREGLQLPWVATFERMGYLPPGLLATPLLLGAALALAALWLVRLPRWPLRPRHTGVPGWQTEG